MKEERVEKTGKYFYGIINSDGRRSFGSCGLAGRGEVYSIPHRDISALVSDARIVDFTLLPKVSIAAMLVDHQRVIENVMKIEDTIVPLKLGTFASDENEVEDVLRNGYDKIRGILEKVKNKVEIDVAATWSDFNAVLKEAGEKKEIKELKEKLLASPVGVTVGDQMRVGLMVQKAIQGEREKYAFQIENALKVCSSDFKMHECMDDKMILNMAFLIERDGREAFDRALEMQNAKFGGKVNFRCVGPLPPYSFFTLEIKRIRFEDVIRARNALRIFSDVIGRDEVKRAYQRAALTCHPDRNSEGSGMEMKFDEVTKACELLLEYCGDEERSLKEEDSGESRLIVRVRQ